ncbi:SYS1-related integral membrane protein [Cordyceps fumosorosea ARSEF 2679]|uniref:SYS1-related integral membrane protein n=1 Tax=Cordyceps fumosorosea (strain ARSEF 2679) TaxID=1081104 RepID=A0A167YA98_CORFA|nr:SYS1-related integral membrane protein [Cordyceps fumosorosea ARSEF 2679]OAA66059.1 SYS1-related integral membrane protein [Cordyceps fumosorosea ARSEF 2679]
MARRRRPPRAGALHELQPLRTAAQIAVLQLLFYAVALVLIVFTSLVAGRPFGVDQLLGWESVRGDNTEGWLMAFVWLFDGSFCMAVAIVILIARSKLVPDFALTVHGLHLLVVTLYTRSLPRHAMWWLTMAASSAAAVGLATWGCRYRELQPVFFGGRILGAGDGGASSAARASSPPPPTPGSSSGGAGHHADLEAGLGPDGDDETGFVHGGGGRGKGRGKDGHGAYEMVQMKTSS